MRIAILCNGRTLTRWQRDAVAGIANEHELAIIACDDPPVRRNVWRHGLYYLLNLFTVRNRMTRHVAFPAAEWAQAGRIDFIPAVERGWAVLPDEVIDWIGDHRIDAVLKFGLNLLKIPDGDRLRAPILSYHHGDPRNFRGRPAGFYEILQGQEYMGQVVQILSNKLDSGEVLAFTQSRISAHSYRATLTDAYGLSPSLLPQALAALGQGTRFPIQPNGPQYRLPSNLAVLKFGLGRLWRSVKRLGYGAFVEKSWRVSIADTGAADDPLQAVERANGRPGGWQTFPVPASYSFYADPFFHGRDGAILVEALRKGSGKGELVEVKDGEHRTFARLPGHISYPAPISEAGADYIVPEICDWSTPAIFAVEGKSIRRVADLDIDEKGLIDPTLLRHEGSVYLFANRAEEAGSVLRLWISDGLFGQFREHPASPVRTSVRGSRMAGRIREWPIGLVRVGQDFRRGYGDGIIAFRITDLSPRRYEEEEVGEASFDTVSGPHTVDYSDGRLLFDWYVDRIAPLAGIRRLLNRL